MNKSCLYLLICFSLLTLNTGRASFHDWDINEVYSNADGSVQFIELFTSSNGQEFLSGHKITSTGAPDFIFPSNSPSPKISAFEGRTRNFVIPNVICRAGSSFAAASRGLILGFAYFETYSLCFNVSSGLFFVCADSPPVLFTPADLLGPLPGRHRSQPFPGAEKIPHPFVPA